MRKGTIVGILGVIMLVVGIVVSIGTVDKTTIAGWFDNYKEKTQYREAVATEENQIRLMRAVPIPELQTSQERKNLVRRLETFNTEDKISYIYLISYGKVMAFYTVKGKVSSVNSLLTTPEQIVDDPHGGYESGGRVIASPDIDGSYGSNGDAIFFYTIEDVYVEWSGQYMLADEPLKLSTQPELVRVIK